MTFFSALNFASSNEDGRTELAALSGPANRLLCITGSGTRPLDMLLSEAKEVIAIDINPTQNELLRLKIAAIQTLSHPDLLAYLGITSCTDRWALHERVAQALSASTQLFWERRKRSIRRGIWYAGRWEKVLRFGAFGIRLIRGKSIDRLFAAKDIETQKDIWARRFDDRIWGSSIRLLGRPWVWTKVIGEPGGAFLPSPDQVEHRLAGAFARAAGTFLFRESDFASLILRGRNSLPMALPLHLLPESFDHIRASLSRLRIVDGGYTDLAGLGVEDIDRFSLSDFGSYCDAKAYAACWDGIIAVAAPGAVFCERHFMNPLPTPSLRIVVDTEHSQRLTLTDRAIIYDIRVGHISGPPGAG